MSNELKTRLALEAPWKRFLQDVEQTILNVCVKSDFGTIRKLVTADRERISYVDELYKTYIKHGGDLVEKTSDGLIVGTVVYCLNDQELMTIAPEDMLYYTKTNADDLDTYWEQQLEQAAIDNAIIDDTINNLDLDQDMSHVARILYYVEEVPYAAWLSYLILRGERDLLTLVEACRTSKLQQDVFEELVQAWIQIIYNYKDKAILKLTEEKEQLKSGDEAREEIDIIIQMINEIDYENKESIYTQELDNRISHEAIQPGVGNQSLEDLFDYWPVLLLPKPFSNDALSRKDLVKRIKDNKLGLNHDYDESGDEDDFMNYHIDEIENM